MIVNTGGPRRRASQRQPVLGLPVQSSRLGVLESLTAEAVRLFHRLKLVAEEVHHQGETTAGRRGVLRGLYRAGAQTVPQMARARPVSRQHIQTLVNALADDGLLESVKNPAHKRSRLIKLTTKGKDLVEAMNRREARVFNRLTIPISRRRLQDAADVLRMVRSLFERQGWMRWTKKAR